MLEVFYSTAMRRGELIHLDVYDVNVERGIMMIREKILPTEEGLEGPGRIENAKNGVANRA